MIGVDRPKHERPTDWDVVPLVRSSARHLFIAIRLWGEGIQIKRPELHSPQLCLLNSDIVQWFAEGFGVMHLLSNIS